MKKRVLSLILVLCMAIAVFASCKSPTQDPNTDGSESSTQNDPSLNESGESESPVESDTEEPGSGNSGADSKESSTPRDDETEESESSEQAGPNPDDEKLEGIYADSILYADSIKGGVQSYYPNGVARDRYYVENLNMSAEFALTPTSDSKLTYLKNSSGTAYIQNTMDVFVRMNGGKSYYASNSEDIARANVYRIGYYYYDVHILDQSFFQNATAKKEMAIDASLFKYYNEKSISNYRVSANGSIRYVVSGGDPYFSCKTGDVSFTLGEYNALQFTIKSSYATNAQLFVVTDKKPNFDAKQSIAFEIINDGEFHTYNVMLAALPDHSGTITGFRLDLGQRKGERIEIKDIKAVMLESEAPYIKLDRTLHTYSDKLHQVLHFVAPNGQSNIEALGMVTEIPSDTVSKLIVKDAQKLHTSLDGVDWATVEYVGFDIKDAGIFGYILPADDLSGKITVTDENGSYVIIQEAYPENGEIRSPGEVGSTSNDFFMGQRIYTDESHDFAEFIKEADFERNPLKGIQSDKFVKYDALRGAYLFDIGGVNFNPPFFSSWNQHYSTSMMLRSSNTDRKLYIRTSTSVGSLENAVLLDGEGMILPIPLEVSKNFSEGEEPVMNFGDSAYGETVFPFYAAKNVKYELEVLNLYQNWGKFPLKQLSSIAYYAPYYHLSIGVTETTCISPWYVRGRTLWTLPDFRSQSAPYWFELEGNAFRNEPQHTNAGTFEIIQYTDADGNYVASENYLNVIDSSGPIYAEVRMDYISDDGKMKISYNHLELPHTDELRPFYEISIEVLEDVSFKNFKKDFSFYSWETNRTSRRLSECRGRSHRVGIRF